MFAWKANEGVQPGGQRIPLMTLLVNDRRPEAADDVKRDHHESGQAADRLETGESRANLGNLGGPWRVVVAHFVPPSLAWPVATGCQPVASASEKPQAGCLSLRER